LRLRQGRRSANGSLHIHPRLRSSASGLDVSGLEIRCIHAFPSATAAASAGACERIGLLRVNKSHQTGNFLIRTIKGRHTLVGASIANHGADLVSIQIGSHQLRARQVGPCLSAAGIAAMAEGTIFAEQGPPLLHQIG
jgi:hypothetical protein